MISSLRSSSTTTPRLFPNLIGFTFIRLFISMKSETETHFRLVLQILEILVATV